MSQYLAPVAPGTSRAPRVQVMVNNTLMAGVTSVSMHLTNEFEAATFCVEANIEPSYATNAAWWSDQGKVTLQVFIGYEVIGGANYGMAYLTGLVDDYEISMDDRTITINGRDLAGLLIDTKTADTYQNQTSSEIAAMLAGLVGLSTTDANGNSTITATATPVGRYYQIDHTRMSLGAFHTDITQWDLLKYLAQQEGFDLFVSGTALYFQPPATTADAYNIFWTLENGNPISNVIGLRLRHSLTLAKGVSVTIKSWNSLQAKPIYAKTADPSYKTEPGAGTQDFVFYVPNLTPQQAIDLANQRYADITRHLRIIEFQAPGDTILSPRNLIALAGTNTAFDQNYYPDQIGLEISQDGGFNMSVTARNVPPTPSQLIS